MRNRSKPLPLGTRIEEYVIEGLLGEGGIGAVYAAIHPEIGQKVAIKILHPTTAADPNLIARFKREARAINRIAHPGIVQILGFRQLPNGTYYLVMERLQGINLENHLLNRRRLEPDEAVLILKAVLGPLQVAHEEGIIHRDLKPENLFLVEGKSLVWPIKILDFGLAKLIGDEGTTQTGVLLGTTTYMAPEQVDGLWDVRSDLYSLGVILYRMLSGHLPHEGDSRDVVLSRKLTDPPYPFAKWEIKVAGWLDRLTMKLLECDPAKRPQHVKEILDL